MKVEIEKFFKFLNWRKQNIKNGNEQVDEKNADETATLKVTTTELTADAKFELKAMVRSFANSAKQSIASIENQSFHKHLSTLANDTSIAIVKYDKGNGVCVLDREEYLSKLDAIVMDESKFVVVEQSRRRNARHPIFRKQENINDSIKTHVKRYVPEVAKGLSASGCTVGKLYGTCKVHKSNYPVRPIVSMINTPEYKLAKYLDMLIKPNLPMKYSVKSNTEVLKRLEEFDFQENDYCVSFDVVSLFTNIPLEDTIVLVANKLYSKDAIKRPPMPKASFTALLKEATGGLFSHRGVLYQQKDGVSMGNPLAPTLANFFVGHLETMMLDQTQEPIHNLHLANIKDDPVLYVRYVDDIFCVFRKDAKYESFMSKLNSLHDSLSFTCEFGGQSIPFLDILIELKGDEFRSTVYRKRTNTNVLLHYRSNVPNNWKTGLMKCLLHRAKKICSDDAGLRDEIKKLRTTFLNNGYPGYLFDRVSEDFLRTTSTETDSDNESSDKNNDDNTNKDDNDNNTNDDKEENNRTSTLRLPYVGKTSKVFANRMRKFVKKHTTKDVRVVYTATTVGSYIGLKDATPRPITPRVVYKFTCLSDSDASYIGYTKRSLVERVKEHLRGETAVSAHIGACGVCSNTRITIEHFQILKSCRTEYDAMVFEAIFIQKQNPRFNRKLVKPGKSHTLMIFN